MNNVDTKYGQVTTEHGDFLDGEPVIVFRARDGLSTVLLDIYEALCDNAGSPDHHLELIRKTRDRFADWQEQNVGLVRIPTSDAYMERTGSEPDPE
jgi:hypothetical protein